MITAERCGGALLKLVDSAGTSVALIDGPHGLKGDERLPVKSLKIDGDKIIVELDRPPSLVDIVGKHYGFTEGDDISGYTLAFKELYEAWLREKGKSR